MIDPSRSGRGGCCLLRLVDLVQDGVEVDWAFDGVGVPQDRQETVRWWRKAAR